LPEYIESGVVTKSHKGAIDKYGAPYINHVTRVINMGETVDEKIVGILHRCY
jgi:hypothetical protein